MTTNDSPVVILSHDVVGAQMAGPGIRYYHLARVLARELPVVLAVPPHSTLARQTAFTVLPYASPHDPTLINAFQNARAIVAPAIAVAAFPTLLHSAVPLVVDGYNPFMAETLFLAPEAAQQQYAQLRQAYHAGDFFICASERQRDWWLGTLEAHGRINQPNHTADPSFRQLLDLVPFGLPETPPQHTRAVIKGVWPGIGPNNRVLLWGGGLWPWLDPLTAIRAMPHILRHRADVRLVFPGTRHPNPEVVGIPTHNAAAKALAQELGLLDTHVFFGDWVAYEDWPNVLLESDVALSLSPGDTLETRLAYRSRILEYIWASVPIIATRGDATSELIDNYGVGHLVDCAAEEAISQAVLKLLDTPPTAALAEAFQVARQALTWERAAEPLIDFCRAPHRAADKIESPIHPISTPVLDHPRQEIARLQQTLAEREAELQQTRHTLSVYENGRIARVLRWLAMLLKQRHHVNI